MTILAENHINVFVFDRDGQPIEGAVVEVLEDGEAVIRATNRGYVDTPIRIQLPPGMNEVVLRASVGEQELTAMVMASVGNHSFHFQQFPLSKWIISVHGIRTRGVWQKELNPELNAAGLRHAPLDYGFYTALAFVWPPSRERQIKRFLDRYSNHVALYGSRPSVVAHSFGTYLVGRAMEKYPEVTFDQVILCGSILPRAYSWANRIPSQAIRVLNDYGRRDFWAKVVTWLVRDSGPSGSEGFTDEAGGRVIQRRHPEFRHSDYFYFLNFRKNWVPFLKGEMPGLITAEDKRPANWRFRIVVAAIIISLMLVAYYVVRLFW